jgi:hypothetical protein
LLLFKFIRNAQPQTLPHVSAKTDHLIVYSYLISLLHGKELAMVVLQNILKLGQAPIIMVKVPMMVDCALPEQLQILGMAHSL